MMEKTYYIYVLYSGLTPCYVGKTTNPKTRIAQHKRADRRDKSDRAMNICESDDMNISLGMLVVGKITTCEPTEALRLEAAWLWHMRLHSSVYFLDWNMKAPSVTDGLPNIEDYLIDPEWYA